MENLPMQSGCACPSFYVGPSLAGTCHGSQFVLFMGLLDTFLRTQCDLLDPCGRVSSPNVHDDAYDFVVIGSGSSGAVVASRLSEVKEWKVLLLEAGGDEPPGATVPSMVVNYWGTELDWKYKTQPEKKACLAYPDKRCQWTRGKVLGGCSVLNGMMYLRGNPRDYDAWRDAGNPGWAWSDVLPYFMKSEDNREVGKLVDKKYHGVGGMMPVQRFPHRPAMSEAILRAGQELGYITNDDLNGAIHHGFAITQTNNEKGSRMSTARAFLRPVKHRTNLHILVNSTATKILINPTTKEVHGVEFIRHGKLQTVRVNKEVVVSGGAVNSPQLLLLSGVGPKDHLKEVNIPLVYDLPGVGHNLHNHVAFYIDYKMKNHTAHQELNWATAMDYMLNRNGPMSSTGLSQLTAKINSKYANESGLDPDVQMFFRGYLAHCARTGEVHEKEDPEHPHNERHVGFSPVVLHPKSRGYIKLASKDPLADPLIYPNYLTHDDDVKVLVEACQIALRLGNTRVLREEYGFELATEPIPSCVTPDAPFKSDKYWACAVRHETGPENHQAGSCKMGPASDRMAVVSPELSVHGVKKLRVMDASIMPTVPSGNTNAPCMMIAEKGVDMIKKKWLGSVPQASPDLGNRFGSDSPGGHIGPGQKGPAGSGTGHMGPGHTRPGHMGPGHMGPGHTGPGHMGPGHMGPGHMGPGQMGPGHHPGCHHHPPGSPFHHHGPDMHHHHHGPDMHHHHHHQHPYPHPYPHPHPHPHPHPYPPPGPPPTRPGQNVPPYGTTPTARPWTTSTDATHFVEGQFPDNEPEGEVDHSSDPEPLIDVRISTTPPRKQTARKY